MPEKVRSDPRTKKQERIHQAKLEEVEDPKQKGRNSKPSGDKEVGISAKLENEQHNTEQRPSSGEQCEREGRGGGSGDGLPDAAGPKGLSKLMCSKDSQSQQVPV